MKPLWVDGATERQGFWYITLPSVLYAVGPMLILQLAGNFNNFGLIYLLTGGGPTVFGNRGAGATDLLISWMYKLTFNLSKFNYAAAVGILIFIPVALISVYNLRQTRPLRRVDHDKRQVTRWAKMALIYLVLLIALYLQ